MKRIPILFLVPFVFFSCIHSDTRPKGESLKEAWHKYWSYKKEGNFKKAFYYENMSLLPNASPQRYIGSVAGTVIKEFEFIKIGKQGSGPKGSTPIEMRLVTPSSPPMLGIKGGWDRVINDYWIKKEGRWYHLRAGIVDYY